MYHYIYKVYSPSGKYYIGRHSTTDVDDGYVGSGIWVRGMGDKSNLQKQILEHLNTFEELIEKEKEYINKCIGDPLNMNFNNSSVGAGIGVWNVAHRPEVKEKTKKRMIENNPMKKGHSEESKQKIRVATMGNKNPFYGQTHSKKTKEKLRTTQTGRIWSDEHKQKLSEVRKIQFGGKRPDYLKRTVPFSIEAIEKMKTSALNREKKECPHCGLVCAPNTAKRWHFDQCKKLGL